VRKVIGHNGAEAVLAEADAASFIAGLGMESIDLLITSPPYCIGKEYDRSTLTSHFAREIGAVLQVTVPALKDGASLCWQVGYHVEEGVITPLDYLVMLAASDFPEIRLRNRIVWTFGHGMHAQRRFSGRHETVLWFSKGDNFRFNLDPVRVPQKYPGKKAYKGPKKGELSGNPLGKNPGDVWEIPNVNARHVEKTAHPCQFPVALVSRFIKALTIAGDNVVDPFLGSGTTAVASLIEGRNFAGCDIEAKYVALAADRLEALSKNKLPVRGDKPVRSPRATEAVSRIPSHFAFAR
jgi:adenine-specific DNA-methyltransferase